MPIVPDSKNEETAYGLPQMSPWQYAAVRFLLVIVLPLLVGLVVFLLLRAWLNR